MPYIKSEDRERVDSGGEVSTAGELNYLITKAVMSYLNRKGVSYAHLNEVIGVLECAKLELYRRVAAKYEDVKIAENGDVFTD
jgi:hypothetical protein